MDYDFNDDAVYIFIPCPEFGNQVVKSQLVMTKEIFIACYEKWIKNIDNEVNALPPAEKTGKWILNDNGTYSCSLCWSWIPNEQHHYARYCLHCGARMVE